MTAGLCLGHELVLPIRPLLFRPLLFRYESTGAETSPWY